MHDLFSRMKVWEHGLATLAVPVGAMDWSRISTPPPVSCPWTCRKAPQGIQQLVDNDEDGDASSDDEVGLELELAVELEDVEFIGDLDRLIGDGDCSEGEGADDVII